MVAHARLNHAFLVNAYARTDVGLVRETNEDAFGLANLGDGERWVGGTPATFHASANGVLLEVSDGMGGAKAGEVASALSVDGVVDGMLAAVKVGPPDGIALRRVIERVSRNVYKASMRPDRRGMGATLTATLIRGTTAHFAQIGDSRAYLIRGGQIGQVTKDQSYVQMLVDVGALSPAEAERSPQRNIVLQVMGQESVRVALGHMELHHGDRLLLCSDGLTNVLDDATILAIAGGKLAGDRNNLADACEELIVQTQAGGAPDNVTVVLADIVAEV